MIGLVLGLGCLALLGYTLAVGLVALLMRPRERSARHRRTP